MIEPAQLLEWRDRDGVWNDTADKARRVIVLANIRTIESHRLGNNGKASLIEVAFVVQVVAVAFLAITIGVAIQSA
ncbi:hypothetical protein [Jiangella alkaliphila]|uniref:Uncharacterized protein n=1 Tax=Jiangella alkaliphila TaxID=419479 RepID=A0A1H2GAN5_9ACTN|nr:hypothetical protein [Jiangella alkaliphila]SDU16687.1 hypothetical protein SAMN04488563_0394 [Jiangella alkaliphila]